MMTEHNAEKDAPRLLSVASEDHMFDLLSGLNVSGESPELPCVSVNVSASAFLVTLTDPDADHVNYIYAGEGGRSRCIVGCDNCGDPGRDNWTPRYPVIVVLAVEPDAERCREDEIDPWWTRVTPHAPLLSRVCTDPSCTIPRRPGFPMHGPHDFVAGTRVTQPGASDA